MFGDRFARGDVSARHQCERLDSSLSSSLFDLTYLLAPVVLAILGYVFVFDGLRSDDGTAPWLPDVIYALFWTALCTAIVLSALAVEKWLLRSGDGSAAGSDNRKRIP